MLKDFTGKKILVHRKGVLMVYVLFNHSMLFLWSSLALSFCFVLQRCKVDTIHWRFLLYFKYWGQRQGCQWNCKELFRGRGEPFSCHNPAFPKWACLTGGQACVCLMVALWDPFSAFFIVASSSPSPCLGFGNTLADCAFGSFGRGLGKGGGVLLQVWEWAQSSLVLWWDISYISSCCC